ncbi:MAG: hypothetical protein V4622_11500 [Bacteroidota bacterium]
MTTNKKILLIGIVLVTNSLFSQKLNHFVQFAGFTASGKNTAYYLRSRLILQDKFNFEGMISQGFNNTKLYNANFFYGQNIGLSFGIELGDRIYNIGKDSVFSNIEFRNVETEELLDFKPNVTFKQSMTTFCLGFAVSKMNFDHINYWRGEGNGMTIFDFRLEALYAPLITYENQIPITNFTNDEETETETSVYSLENVKMQHFGFRVVSEFRFNSAIGFRQEFGIRPGIIKEVSDEKKFTNSYVSIGFGFSLGVGNGRKVKHDEKNGDKVKVKFNF